MLKGQLTFCLLFKDLDYVHTGSFPSVFAAAKMNNDINYKNSHGMKFLPFFQRRGLCWFSSECVEKWRAFRNNSE